MALLRGAEEYVRRQDEIVKSYREAPPDQKQKAYDIALDRLTKGMGISPGHAHKLLRGKR